MNIVYLVNFNLKDKKGLGLVTHQKINALEKLSNKVSAFGSPCDNKYVRVLLSPFLDFLSACYVVIKRPDAVISRGALGFLTISASKLFNIKSVREVHAYATQEVELLSYSGLNKKFVKLMARYSDWLDLKSDIRIFNHPDLLAFYKMKGLAGASDFYTYNGFSEESCSSLSKSASIEKFGLSGGVSYLVFVGSATNWHGVDYLVELQKEFIKNHDNIKIVFGGANISTFDPEGVCINISPLDSRGCSDLIKAADLCLLPVKNNRVSPGSPLKLYDYIVNKKYIVAQEKVLGYCDEVENNGVGICVDFSDSKSARSKIIKFLNDKNNLEEYPVVKASWEDRVSDWVEVISRLS